MKKRLFSVALASLLLATAALSGCTNDSPVASGSSDGAVSTSSTPDSSEAASSEAGTGEKTKISMALWVASATDDDSQLETRLMEKMTDVEFDLIPLERASWQEQINTRVAGGDIPDIIYRESAGQVSEYAKQGIVAEIPLELIKENAPDIWAASQNFPVEVWLGTRYQDVNYGIPMMQANVSAPFVNAWRTDMLEKVGITEVPTTIDEAEAAFEKITNADLNGTGKNDTYGFTFPGKSSSRFIFSDIFGAYGAMPDKWMIQEDGTVQWAFVTDGAGQAIEKLADWYQKGYIDPEFVTTDANINLQKIAAGNTAMFTWSTWNRAQPPQGEFYLAATSGDPNATLAVGPALKGPDGHSGYPTWGPISSSVVFGKPMSST